MKVICVKNNNVWVDGDGLRFSGPVFGEEVTATQCGLFPYNYILAEYPHEPDGRIYSFRKQFFIPLSIIDEMELLEQRKKELLTQ